jgi:site-specific DNA recombinase
MDSKAKTGRIMSRAPLGYKIIKNQLLPSENFKIIEEIYEDFLNSPLSLNQFSKKWGFSLNGMKKILTNFTYIGKIKFNNKVYEGKHSPLISSTLFNHVQDKMEKYSI